MSRIGLKKYDVDAPMDNQCAVMPTVRIMMSQHIGAPAVPVVKAGDIVHKGQKIAEPGKGLSVAIHSSADGRVRQVSDKFVIIDADPSAVFNAENNSSGEGRELNKTERTNAV